MHIIINIGRQLGSGGLSVAEKLAEHYGCKLYDKEILNRAAKESGFSTHVFHHSDEKKGFLNTLFHNHTPHMSDASFYENSTSQDSLFKFQSDAIRHAAEEGSCVFVGRCADYVLRDMPNVINIFITADKKSRIERVKKRAGCKSDSDAERLIKHVERRRAQYYNYYTAKEWGDSSSYDVCISSSLLGIEETVNQLINIIDKKFGK